MSSEDDQRILIKSDIPETITMSPLFSADDLAKLASDHGVERKVVEVVSTMLRIIECRRLSIKP